jgi:hypothetical protein
MNKERIANFIRFITGMKKVIYFFSIYIAFLGCTAQRKTNDQGINSLRFIGEYTLPFKMPFKGTTVGGLSSIDYVPGEDLYYMICDDRGDVNPVRYYTAKLYFTEKGFDSVKLVDVTYLKQKDGKLYPNRKQDSLQTPDPEAMRLNPKNNTLLWSSEGERIVNKTYAILLNPSITIMNKAGQALDTLALPGNILVSAAANGIRRNGGFEGLSFDPSFTSLFVSLEEPIYEDGPRAGLNDTTGWIRIIQYVNLQTPVIQYAYQIDPVVKHPDLPGNFIINGVSDILALNHHQLLVTERSFSTGQPGSNVRIYLADIKGTENVAMKKSLKTTPPLRPVNKKLLLNMDTLDRTVYNIEGATLGPILPNGKRSLVFIADDNFSARDKTQFLLFEIN